MRKSVKLENLIQHPQNDFYFDRMEESKWDDFKQSIAENGLFEAPIITPDNIIVSGHERIRACKELGLSEIEVEIREFSNDDDILTCLIETNIQQRGSIGGSVIKMARRIQALERRYQIKHGNNGRSEGQEIISGVKSQEQLASELGMTPRNLRMIRNLADLPQDFQDMVDAGKITPTAAGKLIVGLTSKEKEELLSFLTENDESVKKFTESQISEYIGAIKNCENIIKDYQELSSGDSEDYMRLVDEKERIKSEAMRSLSELTHAQRQLAETKKELTEAKKRIDSFDLVKQELEKTQLELTKAKKSGTTAAQVLHSLSGINAVASGLCGAELIGSPTNKEYSKSYELIEKIQSNLSSIKSMMGANTSSIPA